MWAYWRGGRDLVYNSITYKPSRYLDDSGLNESLGMDITERILTFSDVPTADGGGAIAAIEAINYLNAPTTVSVLVVDTQDDMILGLAESSVYEIDSVSFQKSALSASERTVTVNITLEISKASKCASNRASNSSKRRSAASKSSLTSMASFSISICN